METICDNRLFLAAYRRGVCVAQRYTVVYIRPNGRNMLRLGITAGKKIGNAVHRNRAKRLIRQAVRELAPRLPVGVDVVIVARTAIYEAKSQQVRAELEQRALRKIQALGSSGGSCQTETQDQEPEA